ncbi:MAG: Smr/MutS family protein [Deltaproteobacteria bacterium]|nr:MAG: Smr/MutS family protein [Deltaproteobacteria bacterium]
MFDNPLEHFATLEGSCPSCGEAVTIRKQTRFRCPECGTQIVAVRDSFHDADQNVFADPSFLSPDGSLPTASEGEPVVIRPGDTLDLHSFSPKEVPSLLAEFIHLCQASDIRLATIIHGKGTGALRRRVRGLLARDPRVKAFYDAPPKSGGWGATLVELRSGRGEANGESQDGDT